MLLSRFVSTLNRSRGLYHTYTEGGVGGMQKFTVRMTFASQSNTKWNAFQLQHKKFCERVVDPIVLYGEGDKYYLSEHALMPDGSGHVYTFYVHKDELPYFERRVNDIIANIKEQEAQTRDN